MKTCNYCGKPFAAMDKRRHYCSSACADAANYECKRAYAKKKQSDPKNNRKKKKTGRREDKLVAFLAEAREKDMTYAEAQVQETLQRLRETGSAVVRNVMR